MVNRNQGKNEAGGGRKWRAAVAALSSAVELHQAGRLDEAAVVYRSVLKQIPDQADALHLYGLVQHQRGLLASPDGRPDPELSREGAELIQRSLALAPANVDAHNNLGNIHCQTGQLEKAEGCFRRVIQLSPRFAPAHNNLGLLLKELGRPGEAIAPLEAAVALDPADGEASRNLGDALRVHGEPERAVAAYRRAHALLPGDPRIRAALGRTYFLWFDSVDRDPEAARRVLAEWLAFEPDDPIARHMSAAHAGEAPPRRASEGYVRRHFDEFAATFDQVLERARYTGIAFVERVFTESTAKLEPPVVLDVGCGTGAAGPVVRPRASRLVGVDLSARMLEKAKARGVYDLLVESEIETFLEGSTETFGAIVCADTLIYFGEVEPLFRGVAKVLAPRGLFIFTAEELPADAGEDFRLHRHGRYSHSERYLARAFGAAGLAVVRLERVTLRVEFGEEVAGLVGTAMPIA